MTRFARAVGSKASNKREEEEATPWSVMVAGVSSFVVENRDGICHSRRECKIFASGVNFSRNQHILSHNYHRNVKLTHFLRVFYPTHC